MKEERLKFISKTTDDGRITGRISFYCKALEVTRQAFYDHLSHKNAPWKYQVLADEMMKIHEEDQFDLMPLRIAIEDNMRVSLCCHTLENANKSYPDIKGCIIHSDRGSQYTSEEYQAAVKKYGIIQSMNSAGGRCHDNARCESMWGICTANGGLPPAVRRKLYYDHIFLAA